MWKVLGVFGCLGLAGCVAPPIITYASAALEGVSFVATGKSVGDHALSAVVDKDCALLRAVTERDVKAVCREYASEDERKAAMAPNVAATFKTLFVTIEPEKVPPRASADPAPLLPVALMAGTGEAGAPLETRETRRAIYLMIGNFSSIEHAEKLAARVSGMFAVVAPAMAGDDRYFRVVAGPIAPGETRAAQSRLAAAGINYSWAASLCIRDLGAPPCDNP